MLSRLKTSLLLATALTGNAFASEPLPQRYVKDASQFCFPRLSAEDQIKYYSKIMNIGASYTHGCIGCDQNDTLRAYSDLTGDNLWFRRNYLLHFLSEVQWKKPDYGRAEKIAILENDPKNRPKGLIPAWSLKRDGYTGEWTYDPRRDVAHLTDPEFSAWLQKNTAYGESIGLVGGIETVRDLSKPRNSARKGILYQTFQTNQPQDPNAPRVIDLAMDGGRMHDFFAAYVSPSIIEPLQRSRWSDPVLRRRAITEAVKYVKAINPSIIMGIDVMFWDSVSQALSYMRQSKPKSLIVRTVLNYLALTDKNGMTFNETRRFNVSEDFFKVLEGISQENEHGPAVPVLFARLVNNPLEVFAKNNYEPVLGAVFGQYFETLTGLNFAQQLAVWLRRMSYSENANVQLTAIEPGWTATHSLGTLATQRIERTGGYYDEETDTHYTAAEVEEARAAYEEFERSLNNALNDYGLLGRSPATPGSHDDATMRVKQQNPLVSRLANWLVLKAIKDLPLFMSSLEKAMQYQNRGARAFTSLQTNNTHIVNVDKFFEHFPYFLKPEIMHPSVFGARQMAGMINKAICYSVGAQ